MIAYANKDVEQGEYFPLMVEDQTSTAKFGVNRLVSQKKKYTLEGHLLNYGQTSIVGNS